jgi:hypothetical protein
MESEQRSKEMRITVTVTSRETEDGSDVHAVKIENQIDSIVLWGKSEQDAEVLAIKIHEAIDRHSREHSTEDWRERAEYDHQHFNFTDKLEHTLTLCDEIPAEEASRMMASFLYEHTPPDVQDMIEEDPVLAAMVDRARRIAA